MTARARAKRLDPSPRDATAALFRAYRRDLREPATRGFVLLITSTAMLIHLLTSRS